MKENLLFEPRKKICPFSNKDSPIIDYKDLKLLSRYVTDKGKIIPSRVTNVSKRRQKELLMQHLTPLQQHVAIIFNFNIERVDRSAFAGLFSYEG